MKLQLRTVLVPLFAVSALGVGLFLLLNELTINSFDHLERQVLREQTVLVQNTVSNLVEEHSQKIIDWAQWDKTYAFMHTKEVSYTEETLNPLTLSALGFTTVLYLTPALDLYHGVTLDGEEVRTADAKLVSEVQAILRRGATRSVHGLVRLGNDVCVLAASPILPNKGDLTPRGVLVATSKVTPETFEYIKNRTNLNLSFQDSTTESGDPVYRSAVSELQRGAPSVVTSVGHNLAYAFGALKDPTGLPLIFFQVEDERRVVSTGVHVRNVSIAILIASGALAVLLLAWVIHISAVRHIEQFSRQIREIAHASEVTGRITTISGGNRSLRWKTAGGVLGVFAIMTAMTTFLYQSYFLHGIKTIEEQLLGDDVERALRALRGRLEIIQGKVIDWAQWDDSYQFITDNNEDYAAANLGFDTLGPMKLKYVLYLDAKGRLVNGRDVGVTDVSPVSNEIAEAVKRPELLTPDPTSGLLLTSGGPVLTASSPILDTSRTQPARGHLVFAVQADSKLAKELSHQTRLSLHFTPIRSGDPDALKIVPVSEETILGSAPVKDVSGRPIMRLELTARRPVYEQGLLAAKVLPLYFVLGGLLCGFATIVCVDRVVLVRIRQLSSESGAVQRSGEANLRVKVTGTDEIAGLANDINLMLEALERTQAELTQARLVAEAANEAKSVFIAKVSHELRTPLHGILGTFRIVLRTDLPPEIRDYLRKSQDAANGLLGIINDILDFSKFASHAIVLENVSCAFRHTVRDVLSLVGPKVYEKPNLELTAFLDPKLPDFFLGDPLRMNQVLVNLVGNAVKFTNRGHVALEVSLSTDEKSIIWKVSDSGCGIPADRLATVFDPFTQADNTATRRYSGTGLGLTITKQLVEAMGGTISVESKENVGSTFTIQTPFREPENNVVSVQPTAKARNAVIVVEDGYFGDFVERSLKAVNSSVRRVNASQRITEFSLAPDDIVFFDGRVLELARYQERLAELVKTHSPSNVVVLIAPTELALRASLKEKNIEHVFVKPTSSVEISRIVLGLTDQALAETDHYEAEEALRALGLRAIIAEDVPLNQLVLKQMLEDNGFTVTTVDDGEALVNRVRPTLQARAAGMDGDFDLIITDIQMPKMDGVEATACIRTMERSFGGSRCGPILIMALTGNAFVEEHTRLYGAGIDAVITKPVDPKDLWQNVRAKVREGRIRSNKSTLPERSVLPAQDGAKRLLQQASVAVETILESNQKVLESLQKVYRVYLEDLSYEVPSEIDRGDMKNLFFAYTALFEQISYRPQTINAVMEMFLRDYDKLLGALNDAQSSHDKEQLRKAIHSLKGFLAQAGCRLGEKIAEIAEREAYSDFYRAASYAGHLDPITRAFAQVVETFMAEQTKTAGFVAG